MLPFEGLNYQFEIRDKDKISVKVVQPNQSLDYNVDYIKQT